MGWIAELDTSFITRKHHMMAHVHLREAKHGQAIICHCPMANSEHLGL